MCRRDLGSLDRYFGFDDVGGILALWVCWLELSFGTCYWDHDIWDVLL